MWSTLRWNFSDATLSPKIIAIIAACAWVFDWLKKHKKSVDIIKSDILFII
jgi:hypothetical protein